MRSQKCDCEFLLVGNPNTGKTLLFNKLTGMKHKVANFPGVTVEIKQARHKSIDCLKVVDFPGTYSLQAVTKDEEVAIQKLEAKLAANHVGGIICVLDSTRLERSLYFAQQVVNLCHKHQVSLVYALNMMDELEANRGKVDIAALEKVIGAPLVPISAKKGDGLADLNQLLEKLCAKQLSHVPSFTHPTTVVELKNNAHQWAKKFGPNVDVMLVNQNKWDEFFLSSVWGFVAFLAIMLIIFQSIFTWAAPLMDGIENILAWCAKLSSKYIPEGLVADFVNDALIGGVGSFLVFVPQIFVLTFLIELLNDTGYLARAAIVCHQPLSFFGLSGKSFLPLLTGHACAIPAIFACRSIESPKKRLLTMLATPLTACSARLPVYGLLIAALIPADTFFYGLIGYRGFSFFALYAFGIIAALVVSALLSKTVAAKESDMPFILELPPYRMPSLRSSLRKGWNSAKAFVTEAGPMIFVVTVAIWFLGYFPGGEGDLQNSYLASMGRFLEPLFNPLGLDWKFGVAVIVSFLAREVFVGTLGTMVGIENADENITSLTQYLSDTGFTLASGIALMAFHAIAMQCVATLAVMKKESGNYKFPLYVFIGYSLAAYVLALLVYRVLA